MPPVRQVLVIKTQKLFEIIGGHFQGFKRLNPEMLHELEKHSEWLDRAQAETDPAFKQFIGYATVVNEHGEAFVYQRASKAGDYNETRLYGKWSLGIGGHVDPGDEEGGPVAASVIREVEEELEIDGEIQDIRILGGINDDSDEVGRVHVGLWMQITIKGSARPRGKEMAQGEMKHLEDIAEIFRDQDVESWSRICFENMGK